PTDTPLPRFTSRHSAQACRSAPACNRAASLAKASSQLLCQLHHSSWKPYRGNQASTVGQNFRPVIVRATDSATPPNPVLGAVVSFQEVVFRLAPTPPVISIGGIVINPNPAPVIIASSHGSLLSDRSGLVNIQPSSGGAQGAVEIQGSASAGTSTLPFQLQSFWPLNPQVSAERLSYKSLSARRDTR